MDNSTRAEEDVEQVYVQWRQGITPPAILESVSQTAFESFVKSTWVAGWVARGRILPLLANVAEFSWTWPRF